MSVRSDLDLSQEGDLDASEDEVLAPRPVHLDSLSDATPQLNGRTTVRRTSSRKGLSTWVIAGTVLTLLFLAGVAAMGSVGLLAVWGLSP
ncbi:MAG: hypothetical protein H6735_00230 [Alphaproteobacteria bacterium]|nr:hypothetical protein [Alphaproteobacteria bacterium]